MPPDRRSEVRRREAMRYVFVDRILNFDASRSIRGVKVVSCQEPHLADHFPGFPVLPGVLMLESAFELAQWFCRATKEFPQADFRPVGVSRVRFARPVRPGDRLELDCSCLSWTDGDCECRVKGSVGGQKAFQARLLLREEPFGDEALSRPERVRELLLRQRTEFDQLMLA